MTRSNRRYIVHRAILFVLSRNQKLEEEIRLLLCRYFIIVYSRFEEKENDVSLDTIFLSHRDSLREMS